MSGARRALIVAFAFCAVGSGAHAQHVSVWLDANASSTRPPAGGAGEDAAYGTLGARLEAQLSAGVHLGASAQLGSGARVADGRWLYGEGSATVQQRAGPLRLLLDASGFGLRYAEPFTYQAQAVRLQPGVALPVGPVRVSARGDVLRGGWSSTVAGEPVLPLPGVPADATENDGDLRIDGGELTFGITPARVALELGGHVRDATNGVLDGRYSGVSIGAAVPLAKVDVFAGVSAQRTPRDDETGWHLGAVGALSERVQLLALLAQPVSDPVFGTRAGLGVSLGASVLIGRAEAPAPEQLVQVGPATGARRSVRVRLARPDLPSVAVAGSFNDWVPVAMERSGDGWTIALSLEPGTYQFAFRLPDGTWFVPEDAQGIVDDGFGQQNATLVVPPV